MRESKLQMTKPLNPNAAAWVAALRSGEYKQGKSLLHNSKTHAMCCLGVACELYIQAGNALTKSDGGGALRGAVAYDHDAHVPPPRVLEWVGINSRVGGFGLNSLAEMNDSGKSFAEIADVIESQPEGLFA